MPFWIWIIIVLIIGGIVWKSTRPTKDVRIGPRRQGGAFRGHESPRKDDKRIQ